MISARERRPHTFSCTVTFDNGATGDTTITQLRAEAGIGPGPGSTVDAAVEKSLAAQGIPNATFERVRDAVAAARAGGVRASAGTDAPPPTLAARRR